MKKKLSIEAAENLAAKYRVELGFNLVEPIDIKTILRKQNILTLYRPLSDQTCGLSLRSKEGDCFILVNSNTTIGRQHFTIGHELYHLRYEEVLKPHICEEDERKDIEEQNADSFASALLLPKEGLLQVISAEESACRDVSLATVIRLEQYFSVSRRSLLIRLRAVNLLTEQKYQSLSQMPVIESAKQYGYDIALYGKGNENLVIGDFGETARKLYDLGKISESHYTELLNLITNVED